MVEVEIEIGEVRADRGRHRRREEDHRRDEKDQREQIAEQAEREDRRRRLDLFRRVEQSTEKNEVAVKKRGDEEDDDAEPKGGESVECDEGDKS